MKSWVKQQYIKDTTAHSDFEPALTFAVLQPDGSWEVDGSGSAGLAKTLVVTAERQSRKVAFLPLHVERKAVRSASIALARTGQVTLSDGTVIRRLDDGVPATPAKW